MIGLQLVALVALVAFAVEANVLDLTDSNFATKIQEHDTVLVEFFAPWCGHCKRLAPEYEKAAPRLLKNDPPVALAKVDCTAETSTCSQFGVSGYPTLKIFKGGEFKKEYEGPREADGIVKVMQKEAGPSFKDITSKKQYDDFLARDGASVVGFFSDADGKEGKIFRKLADSSDDLRFGIVSASELMGELSYKEEVVLFRPKAMENKFEESKIKFSGDASKLDELKNFLKDEAFGLCPLRTMGNADQMKKPTVVAFYDVDYEKNPKGTNYWRNRVMKVAKKLKGEGLNAFFAVSNKVEHNNELTECGQENTSGDKPIVCAYDERSRKFKMDDEFSMDTFEKFVRSFSNGDLEPYLKSEPIPDNTEPLKVAVGKNFDELVNDPEKDVLIEFYAPWCGHCKTLAPKYEELAEELKDEPEIVIVKMDATANDVPSPYEVRGFPTLFFAPKGSKSSPKKYEGGREVKDFINYLAKEATNELDGYNRKGKKKGGKGKKSDKTDL